MHLRSYAPWIIVSPTLDGVMGKLLELKAPDGGVLVAVRTSGDGQLEAASLSTATIEKLDVGIDAAFGMAKRVAKAFLAVAGESQAKSSEVEFGLKFNAKGNVYVVESTAEASIKVKFVFE